MSQPALTKQVRQLENQLGERLFIRSRAAVAWPPANDADPVVQDFVRCCLDNKPAHPHEPA